MSKENPRFIKNLINASFCGLILSGLAVSITKNECSKMNYSLNYNAINEYHLINNELNRLYALDLNLRDSGLYYEFPEVEENIAVNIYDNEERLNQIENKNRESIENYFKHNKKEKYCKSFEEWCYGAGLAAFVLMIWGILYSRQLKQENSE